MYVRSRNYINPKKFSLTHHKGTLRPTAVPFALKLVAIENEYIFYSSPVFRLSPFLENIKNYRIIFGPFIKGSSRFWRKNKFPKIFKISEKF